MGQRNLQQYSNEEINVSLKALRSKEQEVISEVVLYLHEIDIRGYYRDLGYSSLFTYCVSALGYSESGAQRRIQAARALNANPEIYTMLRDGKLTLSAIGELAQVITPENKAELLSKAEGKSKIEIQSLAAQFQAPSPAKAKATVRVKKVIVQVSNKPSLFDQVPSGPVVENRYGISIEVDREFMELYEKAKAIIGHRPMAEVFRKALGDLVQRRTPREKKCKQSTKTTNSNSRYIPQSVRAQVYKRDGAQCTFVSPDGHRCSETIGLQYDHITPFALGGLATVDNLRLTCAAHNQLLAERIFGEKVLSHPRCGGSRC